MFPLLRGSVVATLLVGFLIPAGAQPLRARNSHPPQDLFAPRAAASALRVHTRTFRAHPPIASGPGGVVFPNSNGRTTREVYLWRQPAKIEPHLRDVPLGRPVQVVGFQGDFYAVIMHDGLRGWMPRDAVRPR